MSTDDESEVEGNVETVGEADAQVAEAASEEAVADAGATDDEAALNEAAHHDNAENGATQGVVANDAAGDNDLDLGDNGVTDSQATDSDATDNGTADSGDEAEDAGEQSDPPEADPARQSEHLRMLEAVLFAAVEPLDLPSLRKRLPDDADVPALLARLVEAYQHRGVTLVRVGGKWAFRTAPDLHYLLQEHRQEARKLSRAALETMAIIAYHQPVTRAEIEEIRGVAVSKGTLDLLIETSWVKIRGRRRVPGRPVTYGITDAFLEHFSLETVQDLPGLKELKAAGLLEGDVPADLVPSSTQAGEDPLEDDEAPVHD